MARVGRRPGKVDTRAEIVEAAREVFQAAGYDGASLRGIAKRAKVDPALVHHYFDGKPALFIEVMQLPMDPRAVQEGARRPGGFSGAAVVEGFLAQWDGVAHRRAPSSFVSLAQAMCASSQTADTMREFIAERVWRNVEVAGDDADWQRRRALVSAQLLGVAWARYIMRIEPLASADRAQIARWVGPNLERYAKGPLPA